MTDRLTEYRVGDLVEYCGAERFGQSVVPGDRGWVRMEAMPLVMGPFVAVYWLRVGMVLLAHAGNIKLITPQS